MSAATLRRGLVGLALTVAGVTAIAVAAPAGPFSGAWEVQSMGADRAVTIKHKGNKLTLHRVLWPEFEGERYKLEHLYRGIVQGESVSGELLVREDGVGKWEVLRPFTGTLSGPDTITIDGLPMKRTGVAEGAPPSAQPEEDRISPPPPLS